MSAIIATRIPMFAKTTDRYEIPAIRYTAALKYCESGAVKKCDVAIEHFSRHNPPREVELGAEVYQRIRPRVP